MGVVGRGMVLGRRILLQQQEICGRAAAAQQQDGEQNEQDQLLAAELLLLRCFRCRCFFGCRHNHDLKMTSSQRTVPRPPWQTRMYEGDG
jgi:hypothetical protein